MVTDGHGKGQVDTVLDTVCLGPDSFPMSADAVRNAALEEAAKVCDALAKSAFHSIGEELAEHCAEVIRALKT